MNETYVCIIASTPLVSTLFIFSNSGNSQAIELRDKFENMGASLVKQVASATNDVAGDGEWSRRAHVAALQALQLCSTARLPHPGTTTATVLTRAILSEGCKSVAAGMNPMDLRRGINLAVDHVVQVG